MTVKDSTYLSKLPILPKTLKIGQIINTGDIQSKVYSYSPNGKFRTKDGCYCFLAPYDNNFEKWEIKHFNP
jgi:hypothetical protein